MKSFSCNSRIKAAKFSVLGVAVLTFGNPLVWFVWLAAYRIAGGVLS